MKTLFIPCSFDGLPKDSGSIRLRAEWVCRHWDGAEVYDGSQRFAGYDLYVFQKAYLVARTQQWILDVARWRDAGQCRLAFDLCDPDFLDSEHERRMSYMLPHFDFAVATTEPIAEYLARWLPAYVIPDRVDVEEIAGIAPQHRPTDTQEPRLVWAGYDRNVAALDLLRPIIEELGLEVKVLAVAQPIPFRDFWQHLLAYDILLNPLPDDGQFRYKSDNKTLIAWTLGLPVARTAQELRELCDSEWRRVESLTRWVEVRTEWNIERSVVQWQEIAGERWCDE